MLVCSRALPGLVLLAVMPTLSSASCSKRMLDVGGGQLDPGAGGTTGAATGTAGAGAGGVTGTGGQAAPIDGGPTPPDATVIIPDAGEAGCVRASILLPWRGWASGSNNVGRLDVVTAGDAIAVTNRQEKQ